jgi:hypothetical protein
MGITLQKLSLLVTLNSSYVQRGYYVFSVHAVKADGGCRQMVSFTPRPLYSREKRQQYPLTSEEGWVPKMSGQLADEKHLAPACN